MGKKGWFYAMKKAISPSNFRIKKAKRSHKSKSSPKKSCLGNQMSLDTCSSPTEAVLANQFHHYHLINEKEFKVPENEQIKHVDSVIYATNVAKDEASTAAEVNDSITYATPIEEYMALHAAAPVNFTTSKSRFLGKTREEIAAIKIQKAYRGHMARRAFLSLRAMTRLNLWIQGQAVKHQTTSTLMRIQTMGRVQSQVRARSTRVAEVNETLQRQQKQKREKVLYKDFDLSPKSKEQVDAILKSKKKAAERREKALAYAYDRQQKWRNSELQKSACQSPNVLDCGWSWSSRWSAIRPRQMTLPSIQRSKSANSKVSVTSKSQISKPGLGPLAKKRHLVINSKSFGGKVR